MKFSRFVDIQEQARHELVEALLNEISALQKKYDELKEKYALSKKKALVVVNPIGFEQ